MYSLIITVKSISGLFTNLTTTMQQYFSDVQVTLDHGEGYVIPSLIWPPPFTQDTAESVYWEVV